MTMLRNIINNRPVAILAHGASIVELENRIEELKDDNICFASFNYFPIMQDFILNKINRKLDWIFDCSTVATSFQREFDSVRMKRIEQYLAYSEGVWVTTHGLLRDNVISTEWSRLTSYGDRVIRVDSFFPKERIGHFMSVPGSITLVIASAIANGATKIFLFGFDGYHGDLNNGINSYYKPDLQAEERKRALGHLLDEGINRDSKSFDEAFPSIYKEYCTLFKCKVPIYNCSKNSSHTCLPKLDFDSFKLVLRGI